ncbi:YgjP-like metallopeptidase domain-containing protein [Sporosarcina sp. HYO08]|uniref:YgjP-like metallopeptidase domain-containing protein n=1 Tax=Sporosarcina sp. HYO08 TaxID=1759557 RepID=UPI0020A565C2|nr:YgjP-like metallopeptidase domain-containing protein [Sporosarcina sp. HYO08]
MVVSLFEKKHTGIKACWGSALVESNTILLNLKLIKTPKHCIEYVILNEMIHFKYNNHSDSFYNMLDALMPDRKKGRQFWTKRL